MSNEVVVDLEEVLSRLLDVPEEEVPFDDPADLAEALDELYEAV